MPFAQWVRLHAPARCGLRWGAWYRVTVLTPREAHVWVSGHALTVSRSFVELRTTPPCDWTVVRPSRDLGWNMVRAPEPYLVCPSCHFRAPLPDTQVRTTRCPRCNELFTIAWHENYGPQSKPELRSDHRMTRRRLSVNRRSGPDRRSAERRTATTAVPIEHRVAARRVVVLRRNGWDRRAVAERRCRATSW